jgi:hypothetical protein
MHGFQDPHFELQWPEASPVVDGQQAVQKAQQRIHSDKRSAHRTDTQLELRNFHLDDA